MRDESPDPELATECDVFCRYLIDRAATPAITGAYARAHAIGSVEADRPATAFDRRLLQFARRGPRFARMADSYAVIFARLSVLRRKLVLLVAILESIGSTAVVIDTA